MVVSAVGSVPGRAKITDLLLLLATSAGPPDITRLRQIHADLIEALGLAPDLLDDLFLELLASLARLPSLPRAEGMDSIMGFGERLSARMMSAALSAQGWDARDVSAQELCLVSDDHFQDASILENGLEDIVKAIFRAKQHLVVPGYVGITADGRATTLGRGGSDYTAAVLGAALKREVEIWTDVSGVAVCNPGFLPPELRKQGHPFTVPELSHEEAYQMAAFGSKVLYQKCLAAAQMASRKGRHLRLLVRNTFKPQELSTLLTGHRSPDGRPKGITALEGVQLLTIYLEREEDYRGLLVRAQALPEVRVLMASYSTGRASFVFDQLTSEVEQLEREYQEAHLSRDQVLIKVVGDAMGENHAVLATIHRAIDRVSSRAEGLEKVPPIHKSPQLLTDSTFECVALKRTFRQVILQLYRDLFLGDQVQIGMLGLGTVGGGVLYYAKELYSQEKSRLRLVFPIAAVRDLDKARPDFQGELTDRPQDVVADPRVDVVVEVLGGLEPARTLILQALRAGKHVVTANKPCWPSMATSFFGLPPRAAPTWLSKPVCAGEIPVLEVVRKMPSSQDIEGLTAIMNGTSNFILTLMEQGQDYAEALADAQQRGFAEADPTLDVSGADAAQKAVHFVQSGFSYPGGLERDPAPGLARGAGRGSARRRQDGDDDPPGGPGAPPRRRPGTVGAAHPGGGYSHALPRPPRDQRGGPQTARSRGSLHAGRQRSGRPAHRPLGPARHLGGSPPGPPSRRRPAVLSRGQNRAAAQARQLRTAVVGPFHRGRPPRRLCQTGHRSGTGRPVDPRGLSRG